MMIYVLENGETNGFCSNDWLRIKNYIPDVCLIYVSRTCKLASTVGPSIAFLGWRIKSIPLLVVKRIVQNHS